MEAIRRRQCPHCQRVIGREAHRCRSIKTPSAPVPKPSDFAAMVARARAAQRPQPQQLTIEGLTP